LAERENLRVWYKLYCPSGHTKRELIEEYARLLATDISSFHIKVLCPICDNDLRLEYNRSEVKTYE
jgi:hypothetical protein